MKVTEQVVEDIFRKAELYSKSSEFCRTHGVCRLGYLNAVIDVTGKFVTSVHCVPDVLTYGEMEQVYNFLVKEYGGNDHV